MDGLRQPTIHPRILPWARGKSLDPVMIRLGMMPQHCVVSMTGGCGRDKRTYKEGKPVLNLFTGAFRDFSGAMLIGGTRMVRNEDPDDILFGITEIAPAMRAACPQSFVLGVIPRVEEFEFIREASMIKVVHSVGESDTPDHTTIVHPEQDLVVGISGRLCPEKAIWYDEVEFRRYVTSLLRAYGHWSSVLVSYNGGSVTEFEVRETAAADRPVLLVKGSGRVTDALAADRAFLRQHPNVHTCEHTAQSMRAKLLELDVLPPATRTYNHLKAV